GSVWERPILRVSCFAALRCLANLPSPNTVEFVTLERTNHAHSDRMEPRSSTMVDRHHGNKRGHRPARLARRTPDSIGHDPTHHRPPHSHRSIPVVAGTS